MYGEEFMMSVDESFYLKLNIPPNFAAKLGLLDNSAKIKITGIIEYVSLIKVVINY